MQEIVNTVRQLVTLMVLLPAIGAGLSGCNLPVPLQLGEWDRSQMRYSVSSTADDRLVITLNRSTIDYRRNPFILIPIYQLEGLPTKIRLTEAWRLSEIANNSRKLTSLTYGICPEGWHQEIEAKPLLTDHYYLFDSTAFVIKKNGPCEYELIARERFLESIGKTESDWPVLP